MKRNTILFFIFHFSICFSFAQSWSWGRGAKPKHGGAGDVASDHSVAVDKYGNAYETGGYLDTLIFGTNILTSKVNYLDNGTAFLVKYDANGNALWARQGNQATAYCNAGSNSVALDISGNAYITGSLMDTISFGTFTLKGFHEPSYVWGGCVFLTKYDLNGNVLWAKQAIQASSSSYGTANSVAVDRYGNAYITGDFYDTLTFDAFTLKGGGIFLVKYTGSGNVQWARQSIATNWFYKGGSNSVALDNSGNVYITGDFVDTISFNAFTLRGKSRNSVFLVKYDPNGNVLWADQTMQPTDYSYGVGASIAVDASNHIYQTGNIVDTLTFGHFTLRDSASQNVFLAKYDSNGNVLWAEQSTMLDKKNQWEGFSVTCDTLNRGGGFLVLSAPRDFSYAGIPPYKIRFGNDTFSLSTPHESASLILQFDSAGNVLCGNLFSEGDEDDGDGVGVDHSGQHIYLTGDIYDTSVFGPDTLVYGYDEPFIARWNPCPKSFNAFSNSTNINCNGQCNGQAKAIAYGGTGPYTYLWNTGSTVSTVTGLCPGNYWVAVTDSFGSRDTLKITITQPTSLTSNTGIISNVRCYSLRIGQASVNVNGGTIPYTYTWSPSGGSSSIASNLSAGTYTCTITDKNGCLSYDTVTLTQPPQLRANAVNVINLHCNGDSNGSATISVSGGIPQYTYGWSPIIDTISTASSLKAGTYLCYVTDSNGCGTSVTIIITQPPPVVVNISSAKDTICFGNSITLNATGANTYNWTPSSGLSCTSCPNTIASPTITTQYFITGIDTAGCKDSTLFTLNVVPKNFASISKGDSICAGQSVNLNATGGGSYLWNTGSTTNSINPSPSLTSTYTVIVALGGCSDTLSSNIFVTPDPIINVCCDSFITYGQSVQLITSGNGPFIWVPKIGLSCDTCPTPLANPLQTTTYTLTVAHNGCITQKTVTIDVTCGEVFIPNAFSPNGDGQNDILYVRGPCIQSLFFNIYDRWGNRVFESENINNGWDGTHNGQPMNSGTYIYYLKATMNDGAFVEKKGNVALVR